MWESVFLRRGMATLSLDGPGQGRPGFTLNIRADYEVAVAAVLDAVAGATASTSSAWERPGSASAATTSSARRRSSRGSRRWRASAGRTTLAANWETMPSLTRETFIHHTGAADEAEARRARRRAEPGRGGRAGQAAVPGGDGQARPRDRRGSRQSGSRSDARGPSGCSTRTAPTSATTSRSSTGRWSPTGCAEPAWA